jgi:hypothetical protein
MQQDGPVTTNPSELLRGVVREIEAHVAAGGWDQPARLFALVRTAALVADEPQLAQALGITAGPDDGPETLTPVEQDELPAHESLEDLLAGIGWPDAVVGAAIVVERVVLPPEVERELPEDEGAALQVLAEHPDRQEMRLAVAVLRDGSRFCALRLRAHDDAADVVEGEDLVPSLADALAATLED